MSPASPLAPPADGRELACRTKRHYHTFTAALAKLRWLRDYDPAYWSPQLGIYRCPQCGQWALGRSSTPAIW